MGRCVHAVRGVGGRSAWRTICRSFSIKERTCCVLMDAIVRRDQSCEYLLRCYYLGRHNFFHSPNPDGTTTRNKKKLKSHIRLLDRCNRTTMPVIFGDVIVGAYIIWIAKGADMHVRLSLVDAYEQVVYGCSDDLSDEMNTIYCTE